MTPTGTPGLTPILDSVPPNACLPSAALNPLGLIPLEYWLPSTTVNPLVLGPLKVHGLSKLSDLQA